MKAVASASFSLRSLLLLVVALLVLLAVHSTPAWAQEGSVSGVITDPQDAVIPGATVTLTNKDTGASQKTTTQGDGHFLFSNVKPGVYDLTVERKGFETAKVAAQQVRVGITTTANIKMKVGAESTTIEVKATGAELQTLDASVGNVLDQQALEKLPSLNRDATAVLLIQPLAQPGFNGAPGSGEGNLTGGGIAGARADQNTFMVDGGDASSNTEGGGGYSAGGSFIATPHASIPTPVESLQEFRVV